MNEEVPAAVWVELSEASPDDSYGIFRQPGTKDTKPWRLTGGEQHEGHVKEN